MYMYIHVYIVYILVDVYMYLYICIYICMYMCMHVHMRIYMYTCQAAHGLQHPLLHSHRLRIRHPVTQEGLVACAPVPAMLEQVLRGLQGGEAAVRSLAAYVAATPTLEGLGYDAWPALHPSNGCHFGQQSTPLTSTARMQNRVVLRVRK